MISKSTKKNRRKMVSVNERRSRLMLVFVDKRCDFWYLGIKLNERFVKWTEIYGKGNAIKRMRRLSSFYASQTHSDVVSPNY